MDTLELIRGLQHLKTCLPGEAREDFLALECALLDIFHRQRIANLSEPLEHKQAALLAQCDQLAQVHSQKHFAELCVPESSSSKPISKASHATLPGVEDFYRMVHVQLLTRHVSAAYCFQQTAQAYPLVTITFDTTAIELPCLATVTVAFASYGEPDIRTVPLEPSPEPMEESFLPTLTVTDLKRIEEYGPARLVIAIEFTTAEATSIPYHKTEHFYFYPRNVAVLWSRKEDGSLLNQVKGLAAWVTPRLPQIEELHRKAISYHPERELRGYPKERVQRNQKQAVREQVRALFQALYETVPLAYTISSDIVLPEADETHCVLQDVRLPRDIFQAGGPANCLDGCLLFASLLEKASLQPLLLLYKGHAIVGWRIYPDKHLYDFLETTSIHHGDFEFACDKGRAFYKRAYPAGIHPTISSNIYNTPYLVDIIDCRKQSIVPMDY